jgi:hypothetical protein
MDNSALKPPPSPRTISDKFAWSLMLTNGWAIAAGVFTLLGGIFAIVGLVMMILVVTAFVGIPFMVIGIIFLGAGLAGLTWRYQQAQKVLAVLRYGEPVDGQIVSMEENFTVRVGGQRPWVIGYKFRLNGHDYEGSVSTLNKPDFQPGQQVCVLHLPQTPEYNTLYPHP